MFGSKDGLVIKTLVDTTSESLFLSKKVGIIEGIDWIRKGARYEK